MDVSPKRHSNKASSGARRAGLPGLQCLRRHSDDPRPHPTRNAAGVVPKHLCLRHIIPAAYFSLCKSSDELNPPFFYPARARCADLRPRSRLFLLYVFLQDSYQETPLKLPMGKGLFFQTQGVFPLPAAAFEIPARFPTLEAS